MLVLFIVINVPYLSLKISQDIFQVAADFCFSFQRLDKSFEEAKLLTLERKQTSFSSMQTFLYFIGKA